MADRTFAEVSARFDDWIARQEQGTMQQPAEQQAPCVPWHQPHRFATDTERYREIARRDAERAARGWRVEILDAELADELYPGGQAGHAQNGASDHER